MSSSSTSAPPAELLSLYEPSIEVITPHTSFDNEDDSLLARPSLLARREMETMTQVVNVEKERLFMNSNNHNNNDGKPNDDKHEDEVTSLVEEQGQEALWVEDEATVQSLSTAGGTPISLSRNSGGGNNNNNMPRSPSSFFFSKKSATTVQQASTTEEALRAATTSALSMNKRRHSFFFGGSSTTKTTTTNDVVGETAPTTGAEHQPPEERTMSPNRRSRRFSSTSASPLKQRKYSNNKNNNKKSTPQIVLLGSTTTTTATTGIPTTDKSPVAVVENSHDNIVDAPVDENNVAMKDTTTKTMRSQSLPSPSSNHAAAAGVPIATIATVGVVAATTTTSPPKKLRSFFTRSKQQQVIAAAAGTTTTTTNQMAEEVVSELALSPPAQQPMTIPASDTISSLGFDKSIMSPQDNDGGGALSPLSMSSLNAILDAPLSPTAAAAAAENPASTTKKNTRGLRLFGGGGTKSSKGVVVATTTAAAVTATTAAVVVAAAADNKKKKPWNRSSGSPSKSPNRRRVGRRGRSTGTQPEGGGSIQRYIATVVSTEEDNDNKKHDDEEEMSPTMENMDLLALDSELQNKIQRALLDNNNEDAQSLTSYDGVSLHNAPAELTPPKKKKGKETKKRSTTEADDDVPKHRQQPLDAVKPTFVAALASSEALQRWESLDIDEHLLSATTTTSTAEEESGASSNNGTAGRKSRGTVEDEEETLDLVTSPVSTTADSTDKYTVNGDDDNNDRLRNESFSDDDDNGGLGNDDKYSVLPENPCSFCDSLWRSASSSSSLSNAQSKKTNSAAKHISDDLSSSPMSSSDGVETSDKYSESVSSRDLKQPKADASKTRELPVLAPPTDKYAEIPDVVPSNSSSGMSSTGGGADPTTSQEETTKKSPLRAGLMVSGLLDKLKRTPTRKTREDASTVPSPAPLSHKSSSRSLSKSPLRQSRKMVKQAATTPSPVRPKKFAASPHNPLLTPNKSILKEKKNSAVVAVVGDKTPSAIVREPPVIERYHRVTTKQLLETNGPDRVTVITSNAPVDAVDEDANNEDPIAANNSPTRINKTLAVGGSAEDASSTTGSSSVEDEPNHPVVESSSNHPLVDHIRRRQQRNRQTRGLDPITSGEEVKGRLQLDP